MIITANLDCTVNLAKNILSYKIITCKLTVTIIINFFNVKNNYITIIKNSFLLHFLHYDLHH